jgi:hypothetical protein
VGVGGGDGDKVRDEAGDVSSNDTDESPIGTTCDNASDTAVDES